MQIFISSTFEDLQLHRDAVASALRTLRHHAEDMLFWSGDERAPLEVTLEALQRSDLVLIILAHRYGSIPPEQQQSFVELEFNAARQHNLPILAFLVDDNHPWPPKYIDEEPAARAALRALKAEIGSRCVRKTFTTPENLAICVTQAVANWDKRNSSPLMDQDSPAREVLTLNPRIAARSTPDIVVPITNSVDGSQLALKIKRSIDIDVYLNAIAASTGESLSASPLAEATAVLRAKGREKWAQLGIHSLIMPNGDQVRCYISNRSLADLFAPSVLTRLLPLPRAADGQVEVTRHNQDREHGSIRAVPEFQREVRSVVQSTGGRNRFLAISLTSNGLYAAGWPNQEKPRIGQPVFWRQFIPESLLCIEDVKYRIAQYTREQIEVAIDEGPIGSFSWAMKNAIVAKSKSASSRISVVFTVPVRSICNTIVEVAKKLAMLHGEGFIHGDVKPQNILLASNGPHLIDELRLRPGAVPPLYSPGWAAPEQIMLEPVTAATDVYPLGLMACSALGALLSGQVVTHIVPDNDGRPIELRLLRDPRVYLLMDSPVLPPESRPAWLSFLQDALRFRPDERLSSPAEFAERLTELVSSMPPSDCTTLRVAPDTCIARMPGGYEVICHVLDDEWSQFAADSFWSEND